MQFQTELRKHALRNSRLSSVLRYAFVILFCASTHLTVSTPSGSWSQHKMSNSSDRVGFKMSNSSDRVGFCRQRLSRGKRRSSPGRTMRACICVYVYLCAKRRACGAPARGVLGDSGCQCASHVYREHISRLRVHPGHHSAS